MKLSTKRFLQFAVVSLAVALMVGTAPRVEAVHPSPVCPGLGNPHATLKVWETGTNFCSISTATSCFSDFDCPAGETCVLRLGHDPVEAVEDPTGLSGYYSGADGPTLITAYENTTCPGGPCGVTIWAPDIDTFRCFGFAGGVNTGISLDTGGPDIVLPPSGGGIDHGGRLIGTGSIWTFGLTSCPLAVHLRGDQVGAVGAGGVGGTAKTRFWPVGQAWGGDLDETTGLAYYADPGPFGAAVTFGQICRLDPATNARRCWDVGGRPAFVLVESPTAVWASLSATDEYVRLDPVANTATYWKISGGPTFTLVPDTALAFIAPGVVFEIPDGLDRDSSGNMWAAGSVGDVIVRLNPTTDEICQYTKTGLNNPQLIAVTGPPATRQAYFTEGAGDAISIVTEVEADDAANPGRTCEIVTPVTLAVGFVDDTVDPGDKEVTPRIVTITPEFFDLECEDGFATCDSTCDGAGGTEVIPAIARCSVSGVRPGATEFEFPEGMTGVYRSGEIAGSFHGTDDHFTLTSCAIIAPPPLNEPAGRVSTTKKGSLLVFSKIEIKWDATGRVTQDTFLDLTNDFPRDVVVQLYFINGDEPADAIEVGNPPVVVERAHPGWNWVDCQITLTKDQPTFWSALTGMNSQGGVCQTFTILDPGSPPGRPDPDGPPGSRVLRGYVYAWAVNNAGEEIRWNHLKGDVVIVNYQHTTAWEYNAYAFQSHSAQQGAPTDGVPGRLLLDGFEYDQCFDKLLLDFYASGSSALSDGGATVQIDTDLTLYPVSADLRQDTRGPVHTKAHFDIWNQNEIGFSGTHRCISCWDQTLLSKYTEIANHFLRANLQTDKGKARINGESSNVCEENPGACDEFRECLAGDGGGGMTAGMRNSGGFFQCRHEIFDEEGLPFDCTVFDPLLGVSAKLLMFSGTASGKAYAGSNLVGQGEEDARILYDIIEPPDELIFGSREGAPVEGDVTDNPRINRTPTKASKRGR